MNIESELLDTIRSLPPERRAEVLDFVAFIKQRSEHLPELRPVGLCQGDFAVSDDFDAPLPESVVRDFEA